MNSDVPNTTQSAKGTASWAASTRGTGVIHWLERVAIALGGVLLGALGAARFGVGDIGVSVALPAAPLPYTVETGPKGPQCPRPPPESLTMLGLTAFANGSSVLSDRGEANVQLWASALSHCEGAKVRVLGSTSSLQYRKGSPHNNLWLAKERAETVATKLRTAKNLDVKVEEMNEEDLASVRRLADTRAGLLVEDLAAVSRRADLTILSLGTCEPSK